MNLLFFSEIFARERSDRTGVGEGCPPPTIGSLYTYFTNITNSIYLYREESSTLQEHLPNFYAQACKRPSHRNISIWLHYGYNYIDLLYFSSSRCISHWYFRTSRCERAPLKIYLLYTYILYYIFLLDILYY